tara:strand:+ start:248 stop:406 length:159 start_codon:yes stop_codon:yes gene_type:complete
MYKLVDWMNNRLTDKDGNAIEFETFECGWEYIYSCGLYEEDDYQELYIVKDN